MIDRAPCCLMLDYTDLPEARQVAKILLLKSLHSWQAHRMHLFKLCQFDRIGRQRKTAGARQD